MLKSVAQLKDGAIVFGYSVKDPERFGVVGVDANFKALTIEEKPANPKSNLAVNGLYFFARNVCRYAIELKPSPLRELKITDLNRRYLVEGKLSVKPLGRGFAWLDTGTHDSLPDASEFIATIQRCQGFMIACLEEISYHEGWIGREQAFKIAKELGKTEYAKYLFDLIK